jgi:hypothetical protein
VDISFKDDVTLILLLGCFPACVYIYYRYICYMAPAIPSHDSHVTGGGMRPILMQYQPAKNISACRGCHSRNFFELLELKDIKEHLILERSLLSKAVKEIRSCYNNSNIT